MGKHVYLPLSDWNGTGMANAVHGLGLLRIAGAGASLFQIVNPKSSQLISTKTEV